MSNLRSRIKKVSSAADGEDTTMQQRAEKSPIFIGIGTATTASTNFSNGNINNNNNNSNTNNTESGSNNGAFSASALKNVFVDDDGDEELRDFSGSYSSAPASSSNSIRPIPIPMLSSSSSYSSASSAASSSFANSRAKKDKFSSIANINVNIPSKKMKTVSARSLFPEDITSDVCNHFFVNLTKTQSKKKKNSHKNLHLKAATAHHARPPSLSLLKTHFPNHLPKPLSKRSVRQPSRSRACCGWAVLSLLHHLLDDPNLRTQHPLLLLLLLLLDRNQVERKLLPLQCIPAPLSNLQHQQPLHISTNFEASTLLLLQNTCR